MDLYSVSFRCSITDVYIVIVYAVNEAEAKLLALTLVKECFHNCFTEVTKIEN